MLDSRTCQFYFLTLIQFDESKSLKFADKRSTPENLFFSKGLGRGPTKPPLYLKTPIQPPPAYLPQEENSSPTKTPKLSV